MESRKRKKLAEVEVLVLDAKNYIFSIKEEDKCEMDADAGRHVNLTEGVKRKFCLITHFLYEIQREVIY